MVHIWAEKGEAAEDAGHFESARIFFERGAALGDGMCWSRLGLMYDNGVGCQVNKAMAMHCYKQAWKTRDLCAANNIAVLYREAGNRRLMFTWFKKAAMEGDGDALVEVAKCLMAGVGVRRDPSAAIRSLEAARQSQNITPAGREEAELLLADEKAVSAP